MTSYILWFSCNIGFFLLCSTGSSQILSSISNKLPGTTRSSQMLLPTPQLRKELTKLNLQTQNVSVCLFGLFLVNALASEVNLLSTN